MKEKIGYYSISIVLIRHSCNSLLHLWINIPGRDEPRRHALRGPGDDPATLRTLGAPWRLLKAVGRDGEWRE